MKIVVDTIALDSKRRSEITTSNSENVMNREVFPEVLAQVDDSRSLGSTQNEKLNLEKVQNTALLDAGARSRDGHNKTVLIFVMHSLIPCLFGLIMLNGVDPANLLFSKVCSTD
jgi:hypothetical protein